jgi:HAMP domain-containing protein
MMRLRWERLSIRRKFSLMLVLTAILLLAADSVLFLAVDLPRMMRQEAVGLAGTADVVGDSLSVAVSLGDTRGVEAALQVFRAMPNVEGAAVYGIGGERLGSYQRRRTSETPSSRAPGIEIQGTTAHVARPVSTGEEMEAVLVVRARLEESANQKKHFGVMLAMIGFLAALGAFVLGWLTNRWILRPLSILESTASKVRERKDYSLRTPTDREDEVGRLMRAFNDML